MPGATVCRTGGAWDFLGGCEGSWALSGKVRYHITQARSILFFDRGPALVDRGGGQHVVRASTYRVFSGFQILVWGGKAGGVCTGTLPIWSCLVTLASSHQSLSSPNLRGCSSFPELTKALRLVCLLFLQRNRQNSAMLVFSSGVNTTTSKNCIIMITTPHGSRIQCQDRVSAPAMSLLAKLAAVL